MSKQSKSHRSYHLRCDTITCVDFSFGAGTYIRVQQIPSARRPRNRFHCLFTFLPTQSGSLRVIHTRSNFSVSWGLSWVDPRNVHILIVYSPSLLLLMVKSDLLVWSCCLPT